MIRNSFISFLADLLKFIACIVCISWSDIGQNYFHTILLLILQYVHCFAFRICNWTILLPSAKFYYNYTSLKKIHACLNKIENVSNDLTIKEKYIKPSNLKFIDKVSSQRANVNKLFYVNILIMFSFYNYKWVENIGIKFN